MAQAAATFTCEARPGLLGFDGPRSAELNGAMGKEVPQPLRELAAWVRKDIAKRGETTCDIGHRSAQLGIAVGSDVSRPSRGQHSPTCIGNGQSQPCWLNVCSAKIAPPTFEKLDRYAEDWIQLLRTALPAVQESVAKARAAAEADAAVAEKAKEAQAQRRQRRVEGTMSTNPSFDPLSVPGSPAPMPGAAVIVEAFPLQQQQAPLRRRGDCEFGSDVPLPASGGPTGIQQPEVTSATCNFAPRTASDVSGDAQQEPPGIISGVSSFLNSFDRLFSDARGPGNGGQEGGSKFRVEVPAKYPGVQFRKSKNLEDRYAKYAKNGSIVKGVVEDDEWLHLFAKDDIFLPMKVNGVQILEAIAEDPAEKGKSKSFWFACGQGNGEEEEEVLTNFDDMK